MAPTLALLTRERRSGTQLAVTCEEVERTITPGKPARSKLQAAADRFLRAEQVRKTLRRMMEALYSRGRVFEKRIRSPRTLVEDR